MTIVRLAAIVEGHGDAQAVPKLVHRIAKEVIPTATVIIRPVLRVPASRLRKEGELERQVERAAREMGTNGGILILVDCDWDGGCPAREGPALLERAHLARSDLLTSVVLADKEFESWFIAAAESLRGECGLAQDLAADPSPESIRGAKEWLSRHMPRNRRYVETIDQAILTGVFDLQTARRAAESFDKCYREIARFLTSLESSELRAT